MSDTHAQAKALFIRALDQPSPDRTDFVLSQPVPDEVKQEVLSLLEHHQPSDPPVLSTGTTFADRYRVDALLGVGGSGSVYKAFDEVVGVDVALKVLQDHRSLEPLSINEVKVGRRVTHPSICRVFDVGVSEGRFFVTMELVSGRDLSTVLEQDGPLSPKAVEELGAELCLGLAAAHGQGVLHRDLKPGNILLPDEGGVVLTDFGIAAREGDRSAVRAGTPRYMAPELHVAGAEPSRAADIFAVGAILYEALTGKPPFEGTGLTEIQTSYRRGRPTSPRKVDPRVSVALNDAVMAAISLDPNQRPASALELAGLLGGRNALSLAVEGGVLPTTDDLVRGAEQEQDYVLARPRRWSLVAGLLLLVCAFLASLSPSRASDRSPQEWTELATRVAEDLGHDVHGASPSGGFLVPSGDRSTQVFFWSRFPRQERATGFDQAVLEAVKEGNLYLVNPIPREEWLTVVLDQVGDLVYLAESTAVGVPTSGSGRLAEGSSATGIPEGNRLRTALEEATGHDVGALLGVGEMRPNDPTSGEGPGGRTLPSAIVEEDRVLFYDGFGESEPLGPPAALVPESTGFPIVLVVLLGLVASAIILGVRNLRRRRVDRLSAGRLGLALTVLVGVRAVVLYGYAAGPTVSGSQSFVSRLMIGVPMVLLPLVFYLALEPEVRKRWPQVLVGWAALVRGRWSAYPVGRALLVGVTLAAGLATLRATGFVIGGLLGVTFTTSVEEGPRLLAATGVGGAGGLLLRECIDAVGRGMLTTFSFVFLHLILGSRVGTLVFVTLMALLETSVSGGGLVPFLSVGIPAGLTYAWVLRRLGLLTLVVVMATSSVLRFGPLSLDWSSWFFPSSSFVLLSLMALLLIGFRASTGPPSSPASAILR